MQLDTTNMHTVSQANRHYAHFLYMNQLFLIAKGDWFQYQQFAELELHFLPFFE